MLKLLALYAPAVESTVDALFASINVQRAIARFGQSVLSQGLSTLRIPLGKRLAPGQPTADLRFNFVPVDSWLRGLSMLLDRAEHSPLFEAIAGRVNWLSNPDRASAADLRWLLREGGEREPRKVVAQFAKWIRRGELRCYRTGYDFKRGFSKIKIPMAIIFGDMDPLATIDSTRAVYHAAKSEYLLWRPVKGNSHIELTMGHDIRQICYDAKNLIEYARTHRERPPTLPRVR
jgi:hypothetical protein